MFPSSKQSSRVMNPEQQSYQAQISNLYFPDKQHGMFSNLFIANNPNSHISAPVVFEAPWELNKDRVQLDITDQRKLDWNKVLIKFVDNLHGKFVKFVLNHETNLDYSDIQLCNIINTPLGEQSIL